MTVSILDFLFSIENKKHLKVVSFWCYGLPKIRDITKKENRSGGSSSVKKSIYK
jgi:hypothetical protein